MSKSDEFLVLFDHATEREVISGGIEHPFRVEVPWERRAEWFETLREYLAENGHGANAVLGLELNVESVGDTILCSGTAKYYLLGPITR